MALLSVQDLVVQFHPRGGSEGGLQLPFRRRRGKGSVRAVKGASFEVEAGEVLGLVGESGSGKTTVTRCILGILTPSSGQVHFQGQAIQAGPGRHGGRIQSVFQDPMTSLNPRMSIQEIVEEPLRIHRLGNGPARRRKVEELLQSVALPVSFLDRRPGELSAGQRQRVAIARALSTDPCLLIADEPTSSLDASLRVHILESLRTLQQERGFAMMLVTHDLLVARRYCQRLAVMLRGEIVEIGLAEEIFQAPRHEYTRQLVALVQETGAHAGTSRETGNR
ncbi:MAG: ATP-binding cassette domain-containing protein [Acidobacteriota bacterium]